IKLRLLRKLQTRTDIRTLWRIRQKADIAEAGPARCRQLIVERAQRIPRGAKEITVDARKVAINILLEHGSFNEIDRRGMALRSEARTVEPMQALELEIAIIKCMSNVSGAARGFTAGDI